MSILPYPNALEIFARVSNRLYVGYPLCQYIPFAISANLTIYISTRSGPRAHQARPRPLSGSPSRWHVHQPIPSMAPEVGSKVTSFCINYPTRALDARYIGPIISPLSRNTRRANKVFGSYLAERIRLFDEHGKEWDDKPVSPV